MRRFPLFQHPVLDSILSGLSFPEAVSFHSIAPELSSIRAYPFSLIDQTVRELTPEDEEEVDYMPFLYLNLPGFKRLPLVLNHYTGEITNAIVKDRKISVYETKEDTLQTTSGANVYLIINADGKFSNQTEVEGMPGIIIVRPVIKQNRVYLVYQSMWCNDQLVKLNSEFKLVLRPILK